MPIMQARKNNCQIKISSKSPLLCRCMNTKKRKTENCKKSDIALNRVWMHHFNAYFHFRHLSSISEEFCEMKMNFYDSKEKITSDFWLLLLQCLSHVIIASHEMFRFRSNRSITIESLIVASVHAYYRAVSMALKTLLLPSRLASKLYGMHKLVESFSLSLTHSFLLLHSISLNGKLEMTLKSRDWRCSSRFTPSWMFTFASRSYNNFLSLNCAQQT